MQEKIELLLRSGYETVYLITDHGFVLIGILTESDKLDFSISDVSNSKSQRYILTQEEQKHPDLWSIQRSYKDYSYINVAKSDRPFLTKGVYGFSHGGFTPQEIIIPNFKFTKPGGNPQLLEVTITNKTDLTAVEGAFFMIKLMAKNSSVSLFGNNRNVRLVFSTDNEEVSRTTEIEMRSRKQWEKEFDFGGHAALTVILEDAINGEKLDQKKVKNGSLRNFGGLL